MSPKIIILIVGFLYRLVLRDLLLKAIDDPDEEWDDTVLALLDGLLAYKSNPTTLMSDLHIRDDLSDEEKPDAESPAKVTDNPNL